MRYLVIFKSDSGYDYLRRKDIVASYDISYWGDRRALRWARDAQALTKGTVVLRQTKKDIKVVD